MADSLLRSSPVCAALDDMCRTIFLLIRFFVYGAIFFAVCGVVVLLPYESIDSLSGDVVFDLALSGGLRSFAACAACIILKHLLSEFIRENN